MASWLAHRKSRREEQASGSCLSLDIIWCVDLFEQIASGLAYCHQHNVVHLDLKPANILFDCKPDSQIEFPDQARLPSSDWQPTNPLLADFGLARTIEREQNQTLTCGVRGTPMYMALEQIECRTNEIGPPADVYAFGTVMYEVLYGTRPHEGNCPPEIAEKIRAARTIHLLKLPKLPDEIRSICQKCLSSDPSDRYPDASHLLDDL